MHYPSLAFKCIHRRNNKNKGISLVHSFAKLITKILAKRLVVRLDEMVSPSQSAFIKGRCIQDNFMLVQ
jgi:hypothetical protein